MHGDRRAVLWSAGSAIALYLAYRPQWLARLLLLPLFLAGTLITTLIVHLVLAYFADRTSARLRAAAAHSHHDPVVPLLSIATPAGLEAIRVKKAWNKSNTTFRKLLHPTSAKVSAALDGLVATILDNHLLDWYTTSISPSDPSFPNAVEKIIRGSLASARDRLVEVDWAKLGVSTILPKITTHLELFIEAQQSLLESSNASLAPHSQDRSHKIRGKKQSPGANVASDELDLLLANKYAELAGEKGLHPAVSSASFNSRPSEEKHLRSIVYRILKMIMPPREAASPAVLTMATEIVACAIIRPVIESLSDPDLWNRMIDEKAGAIIREQRMVSKLREALDANPNIPQTPMTASRKPGSDISIKSTTKDFEAFLKSTSRCATLLEAKRLRNDIDANLRRARLPGAFEDESPSALASYIERLATARQTIDKRIAELGGERRESKSSPSAIATKLSLRDILQQPGAMSFFMEFMDRRNRIMLPQFYLTVEGLKDPLEDPDDLQALSQSNTLSGDPNVVDEETAQALRDDVQLLLSSFVRPRAVTLSATIVDALEAFQQHESNRSGMNMSKSSYKACQRNIFSAQRLCYEEMNEFDWPAFQRSDLYNKAAAEVPLPTLHPASSSSNVSVANNTRPRALSLGPVRAVSTPAIPKSGTNGKKTGGLPGRIPSGHTSAYIKSTSGGSEHKSAVDTAFKTDKLDFLTGIADNPTNPAKARSPLFDDEEDPNLPKQPSSKTSDHDAEDFQQLQTMEAIQDALTSILADDTRQEFSSTVPTSPRSVNSYQSGEASPVLSRRNKLFTRMTSPIPVVRPADGLLLDEHSIKRPLLRGRTASYHSQTSGDGSDLDAGDIPSDAEDRLTSGSGIRLAAPGNLQLPAEIVKIGDRIVKLQNQETVLSALLRKAELTGNSDETKILVKSIDALRREVSELSFQKRQFEMQADENKLLPGRTSVGIISTTVGHSQGKDFALYLVEVHQLAEDGKTQISGWLVTRRFSEFVALHANLKDKLPAVKSLDLPQKRLVTSMSNTLLEQRKQGLTKYLKSLIRIPGALANRDVRAFLSQQNISLLQVPSSNTLSSLGSDIFPGQGIIRSLFRTVTSGMDDMFGGPSMLDAIILRLSQQAADFAGTLTPSVQSEDLISSLFGGFGGSLAARSAPASDGGVNLLSLSTDIQPVDGEGLTSFTAPIANFLVEVFDLKEKGSWLRRQAIVIILQQVLGGTIERKVREAVNLSVAGDALLPHIEMLKELVWPGRKMRPPSLPRSTEEKLQTRDAAFRKLTYLMPDVAASLIGRSNARRGARRVFTVLQNRRLLQHIIYTLLDDALVEIFGSAIREDTPNGKSMDT